ncbi:unnamed protein product [Polarella glacialis]|uniref:Uncharacterized protein n=1 Tax=Polarella glacialis TaxID=89957 RepID=A0A813FGS5_POLGL|nr:unnamed protein product [Polarella glacialis]
MVQMLMARPVTCGPSSDIMKSKSGIATFRTQMVWSRQEPLGALEFSMLQTDILGHWFSISGPRLMTLANVHVLFQMSHRVPLFFVVVAVVVVAVVAVVLVLVVVVDVLVVLVVVVVVCKSWKPLLHSSNIIAVIELAMGHQLAARLLILL